MKIIRSKLLCLLIILSVFLIVSACEYQEIADAEYPSQVIYMPSAGFEIYDASVLSSTHEVPTPGGPSRFQIDQNSSRVLIPLSVYRGGIDLAGNINVTVFQDNEIVLEMIDGEKLNNTVLFPSDKISFPTNVEIKDGEDNAIFNLELDLNYLNSDHSNKVAVGIGISSDLWEVNPDLQTTVIVFDPNVLSE